MNNKPDYVTAATKALELLRDLTITETPIDTLSILMSYPHVRVVPFAGLASDAGINRADLIPLFGKNQDASTFNLDMDIEDVKYVVFYNMHLSGVVIARALARELGHIALGHDGLTRTSDARIAEAMCFAHHLMSPRPIIRMLQESGFPLTYNILSATTGCSEECVDGIQDLPGVHVSAELNREVRDLFSRGINEFISFKRASTRKDNSAVIDFGNFMDGYEE